jgi:hypothetical protein
LKWVKTLGGDGQDTSIYSSAAGFDIDHYVSHADIVTGILEKC